MAKGETLNTLTNYKPTNLLINSGMHHWQRGTSITGISSLTYVNDRWYVAPVGITTNVDVDRSTDVPSKNFLYSAKITNQSVVGSIPTSAWFNYIQKVYYPDVFKYIGKRVSYSVWVKTNKAGQYNFFMYMGSGSVFYQLISNVTLTSGVWTKVTFKSETPLPNDITNSGVTGGFVGVHLVSGTDHHQVQSSDWIRYPDVGANRGATGQVNFCDTIGNEFYITGAMVHDSEDENAPFQLRGSSVNDELAICKRYFNRAKYPSNAFAMMGNCTGSVGFHGQYKYPNSMIQTPTVSLSSNAHYRIYNLALNNSSFTTINYVTVNENDTLVSITGASGLTAGSPYLLQSINANAYIDINAEF